MRLPASVAVLGEGLDMQFIQNGAIKETKLHGFAVCSDTNGKTLWIWPMPAKKSSMSPDQFKRAKKIRESWSDLEAADVLLAKPTLGKTTERLGTIKSIGYRSDKWSGRKTDYQHEYDSAPVIYRSGHVYRVSGGNQRVTPRGIVG